MLTVLLRRTYRLASIAVLIQALGGIVLVTLSFFHKISIEQLDAIVSRTAPWLFGSGSLVVLAILLERLQKPGHLRDPWRLCVGAIGLALVLLITFDVIFGWTHRIEPFELRLAILSAMTGVGAVFVVVVMLLSLRSKRKQQ